MDDRQTRPLPRPVLLSSARDRAERDRATARALAAYLRTVHPERAPRVDVQL